MKTKQKSIPILTVGGSSILTIFGVLCLIVFALLSLSTAKSNASLSQESADSVEAYYKADCEAETIFADLRQGNVPDSVSVSGSTYSYQCAMTDTQAISVKVRKKNSSFTILEWKKIYTGTWQPDDTIDLWDGTTDQD